MVAERCGNVVVPRQAAILQQTADYIFALEQEKTQLLAQNNQLKRFIQVTASVAPRRKTLMTPGRRNQVIHPSVGEINMMAAAQWL